VPSEPTIRRALAIRDPRSMVRFDPSSHCSPLPHRVAQSGWRHFGCKKLIAARS
jgi:hypothetical protein